MRLPSLPSLSPPPHSRILRRLPVLAAALVMVLALGGAVAAVASSSPGRAGPRLVAPPHPAAAGSRGTAGADEFGKTAETILRASLTARRSPVGVARWQNPLRER